MTNGTKSNWSKASDIVFISSCIVVVTVLVLKYTRSQGVVDPNKPLAKEGIALTNKIPIETLGLPVAQKTALVVIVADCICCLRSVTFYARLMEVSRAARGKARVVFACLTSIEKTAPFFKQHGLNPDAVVVLPQELRVPGTPTLLVIDQNGTVINSWAGQLSPDQELKVNRLLQ